MPWSAADIETDTSEQLRRLGADVTGFAARAVTPQLLDGAELVLTMTRAHRGEVARLRPAAMRRIFALGDFADLCRSSQIVAADRRRRAPGSRRSSPKLPPRAARSPRGTLSEIDVVDPYGGSARMHSEAFDRIEDFLEVIVGRAGQPSPGRRGRRPYR